MFLTPLRPWALKAGNHSDFFQCIAKNCFFSGSGLGPEPAGGSLHYFLRQGLRGSSGGLSVKPHQHPRHHIVCAACREQLVGAGPWHLSFSHWRRWSRTFEGTFEIGFREKCVVWNNFFGKSYLPFASKAQLVGTREDLMLSRGATTGSFETVTSKMVISLLFYYYPQPSC